MSEVKSNWQNPVPLCKVSLQYDEGFRDGISESKRLNAEDFDRVVAERDAALSEIASLKDGAHTDGMLRVRYGKEIEALRQRLTAADNLRKENEQLKKQAKCSHGPWADNNTYCISCGFYDDSRAH